MPLDPEDLAANHNQEQDHHRASPTKQAGEELQDLEVLSIADDQEGGVAQGLWNYQDPQEDQLCNQQPLAQHRSSPT